MNIFAKFDENPAITLQVIKKTKRYRRTHGRTHGRMDNVKTVYPTTNKVCGGYKNEKYSVELQQTLLIRKPVIGASYVITLKSKVQGPACGLEFRCIKLRHNSF